MQAISENESKHRENKQPINVKEAKVQAQPCGLIKTRSGVRSERWVKKRGSGGRDYGVSIGGRQRGERKGRRRG
jgi:hypothetical protein